MRIKSLLVAAIAILLSTSLLAQKEYENSVNGKIVEHSTGKPIEGAVVFLSQSCYFAKTDAAGIFEIKNIIPGSYQFVAVAKNHEPIISTMYIEKGNKYPMDGGMVPFTSEKQALFNSQKGSNFESDYLKFERHFIGQTAYMGSCRVENPDAMHFTWSGDVIEGSSNGLIVYNHSKFGYKLYCVVFGFRYDTKQLTRGIDYALFFEEMKPKDEDELETWEDYRKEAFEGSLNHFLWAFRNDRLEKEDYEVYTLRSLGPAAMMSDGMDEASNADSQFQNRILKFEEVSLGQVDGTQMMFTINGFLKVVFKPRSYSRTTSFLQVRTQGTMTLDQEGFTDVDMPFTCFGYWGKNGISNMLPKEYRAKL